MRISSEDRTLSTKLLLLELFTPGSKRGREAQELVEYALLVGFIVVSVAAVVPYQLTGPIANIFNKIDDFLKNRANGT